MTRFIHDQFAKDYLEEFLKPYGEVKAPIYQLSTINYQLSTINCYGYFQSAIIVIHKLPKTPDTLWLRVLGREKVQQEAIGELEQLQDNSVLRSVTLELLYNLHDNLRSRQGLNKEDEELMMRLEPLYKKYREEAVQEGVQQERRNTIENMLLARFDALDPELETIIEPLLALSSREFYPLLSQLSREELLRRFRADN